MPDKSLTEAAWKAFSRQGSYKDAAFVKALAALDKAASKGGPQDELDALDDIDKQSDALRKAHKGDKKLEDYLDDVGKALVRQRKASQDALKQAEKESAEDEEEESPALLTSKMIPLIREVRKGNIVLQAMVAVAGKETVVLLSRKSISPARGKLLKEQMEKPAGIKYIRGECTLENNAITFIVQGQAAGLAKRVKAALFRQVEQRLKIRVRGEDPNDIDDDEDEEGGGQIPPAPPLPESTAKASPEEALQARFESRLADLEPKVAEALKAQRGDVGKIRAVAAFAREKGAAKAWQAGLQSLDMLEKLLAVPAPSSGGEVPPAPPLPESGKPGVDPAAAFNARLAALMPKIKDAVTAGGPAATDIKLKASEAGVFARKREFDAAQGLLDEVEELLGQSAGIPEAPPAPPKPDPKIAAHRALVARLRPQIERASRGGLNPAQQEALQKVQAAWNLAEESAEAGNLDRALLILQKLESGGLLAGLAPPTGDDEGTEESSEEGAGEGGTGGGDTRGRIVRQRTFMIQEWSKMPGELRAGLKGLRAVLSGTGTEADEDPEGLVDAIEDALEDLLDEIRDKMDDAINAGDAGAFAGLRAQMRSHPLIQHLNDAPDFDGGALLSSVEAALDRIERGMRTE